MNSTALVTGASRGIGAATARALARAGCRVALNYRQGREDALALERELGPQARAFQADISREEEVAAMLARIEAWQGPVDILVNNAGIALEGLLTDTTVEEWDRVFAVNVRGAFLCARGVLPGMISRRRGRIVNIASMWGQVGASCEVAYSASKAALIGMTRALAKEVAPCGITVNCVAPGVVDTAMMAGYSPADIDDLNRRTPLGRMAAPEEIAGAVLYLAGDAAGYVTGEVLPVTGGFVI